MLAIAPTVGVTDQAQQPTELFERHEDQPLTDLRFTVSVRSHDAGMEVIVTILSCLLGPFGRLEVPTTLNFKGPSRSVKDILAGQRRRYRDGVREYGLQVVRSEYL